MPRKPDARTFGQDLMRGEHILGTSKTDTGGVLMAAPSAADPAFYDKKRAKEKELGHTLTTAEFQEKYYEAPEGSTIAATGTSIFDPVLCELAYKWFSPAGGVVLDPFAGGSVRGIVAGWLGRPYVGVELRAEQVEANRQQALAIGENSAAEEIAGGMVRVKVSAKMARLRFNGCDPDYIANVCHASCCQSSTSPTGTMITVHPTEEAAIKARGETVVDGLLQPRPGEKRCPFKTEQHLCGLHFTDDKPFGCIASPFTLSPSGGTLIVRNRYRLLKCYNDGNKIPAYKAFRASLDLIFGTEEAQRICDHFDARGGDIIAEMTRENYDKLRVNDEIKKGGIPAAASWVEPTWHCGDSRGIDSICSDVDADFIFSCPPYADLEVYSDNPQDLSTMKYPDFREAYFDIIAKTCSRLKPDRFACFVVGDVRDKRGNYYNFVGDTVEAFRAAGLHFYNEAILVTSAGSLPIRAGKQFVASRKLGKTHQNVLVFVKGDGKKAAAACGECDFGDIEPPDARGDGDD